MLHIYSDDSETGAKEQQDGADNSGQAQDGRGSSTDLLALPLHIPKNRSTGNLAVASDTPDKARIRFSFDAGAAAAEYDNLARSPLMTDHGHGMGRSGLRRIRHHVPIRAPTMPANSTSRSPSTGLLRSVSMTTIFPNVPPLSLSHSPSSPNFTEDLTRFPSESLHSFSFAHQSSDDLMHNRQAVLKRSADFMMDRMGWSAASNAIDAQTGPELHVRAHPFGPFSGPPHTSSENIFESQFIPRTASPEPLSTASPRISELPSVITEGVESPLSLPSRDGDGDGDGDAGVNNNDVSVFPGGSIGALAPPESTDSSRTPTNESGTTQKTSPPASRHPSLLLKRAMTDTAHAGVQQKLIDALARPFGPSGSDGAGLRPLEVPQPHRDSAGSPSAAHQSFASPVSVPGNFESALHAHATRWVPAAQAIFTTEAKPPFTIIAANDLACLVFGVTRAEVRKMGILEVVQEDRRAWLERKLLHVDPDDFGDGSHEVVAPTPKSSVNTSSLLGSRSGGITARLLSKPNSRQQTPQSTQTKQQIQQARRSQTENGGAVKPPKSAAAGFGHHHHGDKSRGVLLCGDVVPIQKRNGLTGSASLWVKEKRIGLIWVLEEIHEDVATVTVDDDGFVTALSGSLGPIWGDEMLLPGVEIGKLVPRIPRRGLDAWSGPVDFHELAKRKHYTCRNCDRVNIPATIEPVPGQPSTLRVSSFPHIAGIIVVSTKTLTIASSNSVFCGALFGYDKPNGLSITQLVPDFEKLLQIFIEVDDIHMTDGIVVPEHSFRKASAFVALREGRSDAATVFLRPEGLPARHRDGSELTIDVQMRVVKSEKPVKIREDAVIEASEEDESETTASSVADDSAPSTTYRQSEMVYALWITYSRHLHATRNNLGVASPLLSGTATPLHQPSPGQTPVHSPVELSPDLSPAPSIDEVLPALPRKERSSAAQNLTRQLRDVARTAASRISGLSRPSSSSQTPAPPRSSAALPLMSSGGPAKSGASAAVVATPTVAGTTLPSSGSPGLAAVAMAKQSSASSVSPTRPAGKKTIDDFVIIEEMGQGAYGQVKLAKYKATGKQVVVKYVTKKRILVDTWTRDRRLGTVPLEIHVLDYLRRDGLQHPNIVEMEDFFEDDVNYYIEMVPHGMPGMDLFDYIELRTNMEEDECRSIFVQVAQGIHHLHTKAHVVHRDIKDENVVLDGEGHVRLIDFGSAAYIKSGPFDVFVGTIDYAAPEVLAGRPYGGREQDVWALGILLYTIIYKENPFYSIDEIMDRDLRVPYTISDESIDLIRHMLDRDVAQRYTIDQVLQHPWCQLEV